MEDKIRYLTKKEASRNAEAGEQKSEGKRLGFDFGSETKPDG